MFPNVSAISLNAHDRGRGGPTFVCGLTAVVEDLHVDDGVGGGDGGPSPPAPPLAVVVPLPQLPHPRRRRRRLLTARVRRPSGRVQVQGAAFQVTSVTIDR